MPLRGVKLSGVFGGVGVGGVDGVAVGVAIGVPVGVGVGLGLPAVGRPAQAEQPAAGCSTC